MYKKINDMKNFFLVIIVVASALFLTGAKDYKPIGESLGELEKFLSGWVAAMDNVEAKVANIEGRLAQEAKTMEDLSRMLSSIERNISDMNERLKKVEKLPTFFSEMPTETLGKTLRFYNESIAELKKQIEEQSVITSVLEKRYQEAQKPLEPLMREIEGVRNDITNIVQRVDNNAATIEEFQKNIQATVMEPVTAALQQNEKVFLALSERIGALEEQTGLAVAEAVEAEKAEEAPPEAEHEAEHGAAEHGAEAHEGAEAEEVAKEAAAAEPEKTPEEEGYQDIGQGFYIKNVKFDSFGSSTKLSGELKNYSKTNYSVASFTIKVYNTEDLLIGRDDFTVHGFKHNTAQKFEQIITGVGPEKIFSYSITFNKPY